MRWPSALLIGVICAVLGTVLALVLGDAITKAYRVSNFEGQRGYAVVFLFAPAGLLLGLIIGIVAARMSQGVGRGHFFKTQGLALLVTGVVAGGVSGLALLLADRPPKLGGNELNLEFEIRIPTDQPVPKDLVAEISQALAKCFDVTRRSGSGSCRQKSYPRNFFRLLRSGGNAKSHEHESDYRKSQPF